MFIGDYLIKTYQAEKAIISSNQHY